MEPLAVFDEITQMDQHGTGLEVRIQNNENKRLFLN
jgi:hypothetical protein